MAAYLAYYEILGLEAPPTDRKAVKRAYSKKLKVTRPDDDPDGFMRLRDAYDRALDILARQEAFETIKAQDRRVQEDQKLDVDPELEIDPSYTIGATPHLAKPPATSTHAPENQVSQLIDELERMLQSPKYYNDRASWNTLFHQARDLDIDDFANFEKLLLEKILRFHDYSPQHPLFHEPENMPQRFSTSITASLFKTMNWDQINSRGPLNSDQIEWLERRMNLRKPTANMVPIPDDPANNRKRWIILAVVFFTIQFILMLVKS